MRHHTNRNVASFFPVLGLFASVVLIGWEYLHGGVKTHHFLARSDMPGFSNWWGLFVLPFLGWASYFFVRRRGSSEGIRSGGGFWGFVGSFVVGVVLSVLFAAGKNSATSALFFGVLASGIIFPIYRIEYVFGFAVGMCFVFGPVIPVFVALVCAAVSAFSRLIFFPSFVFVFRRMRAFGRS